MIEIPSPLSRLDLNNKNVFLIDEEREVCYPSSNGGHVSDLLDVETIRVRGPSKNFKKERSDGDERVVITFPTVIFDMALAECWNHTLGFDPKRGDYIAFYNRLRQIRIYKFVGYRKTSPSFEWVRLLPRYFKESVGGAKDFMSIEDVSDHISPLVSTKDFHFNAWYVDIIERTSIVPSLKTYASAHLIAEPEVTPHSRWVKRDSDSEFEASSLTDFVVGDSDISSSDASSSSSSDASSSSSSDASSTPVLTLFENFEMGEFCDSFSGTWMYADTSSNYQDPDQTYCNSYQVAYPDSLFFNWMFGGWHFIFVLFYAIYVMFPGSFPGLC